MPTYTVSQVASYIKDALESDPSLVDLWIDGEVSGLSIAPSGHAYFNLKDRQSVLAAVMFRNQRGVKLLANGDQVTVHGRVSFYQPRGTLNLTVDVVAPVGLGDLALELERLRQKLESEGLFDPGRKRPIPQFPEVIGVVTSPTGAVFHDIQNVLSRRYPLAKLVLSPTPVQGEGAAASIVEALDALDREGGCDVIIVARGGGSPEDLRAFNDESVARAIYACRTPVVSGVGHETDESIADWVADLRAPTPSAAAELVTPDVRDLRYGVERLTTRMDRCLQMQFRDERAAVERHKQRLQSGLPDFGTLRRRVDELARMASASVAALSRQRRSEVDGLHQRLRGLNPTATLARGFAVVQHVDSGKALTSHAQARPGDRLLITLADGELQAAAGAPEQQPNGTSAPTPPPAANGSSNKRRRNSQATPPAGARLL